MKILTNVKTVISYICTLFVGVYALGFAHGEVDFFRVLGCTACVVLAVITSPLCDFLFKSVKRGK
jgi:hypothetical protein